MQSIKRPLVPRKVGLLVGVLAALGVTALHAGEREPGAPTSPDVSVPRSPESLLVLAESRQRLAALEEARLLYQELFVRFAAHPLAAKALARAFELDLVLGELDQALDRGHLFAKRFGASKPTDAATVVYRMGEVFEKRGQPDQLESHLRGYLVGWGKRGGVARQVVAHFKLGELLWKRSCPHETTHGSCVELERPYNSPLPVMAALRIFSQSGIHKHMHTTRRIKERCRPLGNLMWKAIPREPRLAREAQEHFKTALLLSDRPEQAGPSSPELTADFAFARAGTAFYRAEAIYEQILDTSFPPDLDFQNGTQFDKPKVAMARAKKREESLRKLTGHMWEKNRLLEQMVGPEPKGLYERVSEYGVPHWRLAALARMAQAHANLANQLFLPPIPKGLKEQDEWGNRPREIFCDELASFAEPFEAKAVRGYQVCLETASKQPWWNEWSALCEEELHRIDPVRYPLSSEMGAEADFASPFSVPPAVQHDCVPCEIGTR